MLGMALILRAHPLAYRTMPIVFGNPIAGRECGGRFHDSVL